MRASLAQHPGGAADRDDAAARADLPERHAAARRRRAAPGRLRRAALGDDRHAVRDGAPQHAARRVGDAATSPTSCAASRAGSIRRCSIAASARCNGQAISFYPRAQALGVVLPSNSPGVHGLWVPAIALKMPLVLRPGSAEPWTPFRIVQALMKAGVPGDAFCYFPSDHAGAGEIVRRCGRSMFFGDVGAVGRVRRRSAHRAARPRLQQGRCSARTRPGAGATRSI